MITPEFSLDQDFNFIYIQIRIKYVKLSKADFFVDKNKFMFYLKPYLLDLKLPGYIIEDSDAKAIYDQEKGFLNVKISKLTKGEEFKDLNMISLLNNKSSKSKIPKKHPPIIQVISETQNQVSGNIQSNLPKLIKTNKYGFNEMYSGVFINMQEEMAEFALFDVECVEESQREILMREIELKKFDEERYIYDNFVNPDITNILEFSYNFSYNKGFKTEKDNQNAELDMMQNFKDLNLNLNLNSNINLGSPKSIYSEQEFKLLISLPKKEYIFSDINHILAQLVDILFSYSYDILITLNEHSIESAWNICMVSPTLSCFVNLNLNLNLNLNININCNDPDNNLYEILKRSIINGFRRVVIFPLYRNFLLAEKAFRYLKEIFLGGKIRILKSLLDIYQMFKKLEAYRLLNSIFIEDFLIWIQSVNENIIKSIIENLTKIEVTKKDLNLNLPEIENFYQENKQEFKELDG